MADNVVLPGDGLTIATDEVDGKHYEKVKIVSGGEGVANEINPATEGTLADIKTNTDTLGTPVTTSVTLTSADTDYLLPTSEKVNRKTIVVSNNSAVNVYIGQTGVIDCDSSPAVGILLPPNGTLMIDCSSGLYAQCDTAGTKLTITEF